MPFQPVPKVAEVRMIFQAFGQEMQNIYHVHTTETWSGEFLENLADTFLAWYTSDLRDLQSSSVTLEAIKVRDLSEEFAGYFEITPVADNVGTRESPMLPGNVTAVTTWTTGLTGRSTRGRTYHIGLTEDAVTGNELTGGFQAAMFIAYNNLISEISTEEAAWTLRVVSRVQGGLTLLEALSYEIIANALDSNTDSQRRRLAGRGR